jgi:hypothetical protein
VANIFVVFEAARLNRQTVTPARGSTKNSSFA